MAISTGGGGDTPMSDINTTPLVDVMLVLLIIFLIAVPVAIQTIEKLEIPVFESVESKDKVENLLLTVSTTDDNGVSAGEPGFAGASRSGECRVYFGNVAACGRPGSDHERSGEDPAGSHTRRRQCSVVVCGRCDLQRPGGGLSHRWLHLEPGRPQRLIARFGKAIRE